MSAADQRAAASRTARTRFDFTEPLKWNAEMTDREVELMEQERALADERMAITRQREAADMRAQAGRFFREIGREVSPPSSNIADPYPKRIAVTRYIRIVAVEEEKDDGLWMSGYRTRCVGFDVAVNPPMLLPRQEWRASAPYRAEARSFGARSTEEITNVEYHKAWMEAVEALTLP